MIPANQLLIRSAVGGSSHALTEVLAQYDPLLVRAVRSVMGRSPEFEDVLQEARMRIASAISDFDDSRPFGPWAQAVARNTAIQVLRRMSSREHAASTPELVDVRDPSSAVIEESECQYVREASARLPEHYRLIIDLRIRQGLSHQEIGSLLGLSPGATRVRFTRALAALRSRVRKGR